MVIFVSFFAAGFVKTRSACHIKFTANNGREPGGFSFLIKFNGAEKIAVVRKGKMGHA